MTQPFIYQILDHKPDLLSLHRNMRSDFPFLLQSVAHGNPNARYDILFALPGETLALDASFVLNRADERDFLHALDKWFSQEASAFENVESVPFSGGWFLFLGYELAQQIEPVLKLPKSSSDLPVALAVRTPAAVIYDHELGRAMAVAEQSSQLEKILHLLTQNPAGDINAAAQEMSIVEQKGDAYVRQVESVLKYIRDGDVFQVNLSRAWRAFGKECIDPVDVYHRLCQSNPAPFAGIMQLGNTAVISSSPERLVRVQNRAIETRPIAGTRKRARDPRGRLLPHEDHELTQELIGHPKERAEHVMLIDLERNDLGRVAKPGSVQVDELMVIESYEHVHHIVSNVVGELRDEVLPGDVIRAVFPGGTITGCPKVRCMEIIAELEQTPREAYTGSFGYLNRNGDMDLNILIRTLQCRQNEVLFRAGAGIVYDSDPQKELEETRAKAKGLLNALN